MGGGDSTAGGLALRIPVDAKKTLTLDTIFCVGLPKYASFSLASLSALSESPLLLLSFVGSFLLSSAHKLNKYKQLNLIHTFNCSK